MPTRRGFGLGLGAAGGLAVTGRAASGWHVPDEAAPHARTFMQWPVNRAVHPDPVFLGMLQRAVARIANRVAEFEPVVMLMEAAAEPAARRHLGAAVEIWDIPTEDLWCRDSGPLFAVDGAGGLAVVDIRFNGWGGKQVHRRDGQVARRVAERMGLPLIATGLTGEPGGVEADGAGTLIAHESSWVNPNRNRGSRDEIGAALLAAYGAERMIWAPGLMGEDITDYHIDALARFVAPGRVAIQLPEAPVPGDPFVAAGFETRDILAAAGLELTPLPDPVRTRVRSADFVASYANYYVCNGAVIVAEFGDAEADAGAAAALAAFYPGREVVQLNVDPVGEVGGGIHCATQQQPAV